MDILFYKDQSPQTRVWLEKIIPQEYKKAEAHPDCRRFLKAKFPALLADKD